MSIRLAPLGVIVASLFAVTSAHAASVLLGGFNFGYGYEYFYTNHTAGTTGTLVIDAKGKVSYPVTFLRDGGTSVNLIAGDTPGNAVQLLGSNNAKSTFTFTFDSSGFTDIQFSFAAVTSYTLRYFDSATSMTKAATSGFTNNVLSTSINGTAFNAFGSPFSPNAVDVTGKSPLPSLAFQTVAFDLTSVAGLNNNANAAIRITIDTPTGGSLGVNVFQIDNVQITGTPIALGAPAAVPLPPAAVAGVVALGAGALRRRRQC